MKISLHWLRELVEIPDLQAEDLSTKTTLHTAEVEEIINIADNFNQVFVAKLVSVKPHPEDKKLHVGQFDVGEQGSKQIIFGSVHPLKVNEMVPVALDGAKLKSGLEIEFRSIRGIPSEGMVCDNQELGWKNTELLRFTDEALVGRTLVQACPELSDQLLDIDNKSLTHRPDLFGLHNFAREIAANFDRKLHLPEPKVEIPSLGNAPEVRIETDRCRRFCALGMEGVKVKPSDHSVQLRLENIDTRAISNFVDITNYVMNQWGQPMHVFDADKVSGALIIRQAQDGEKLTALDGNEYELTSEDMVIADEEKVLSIAGIMGGEHSGVTTETTRVIFESANFDPVSIRKTSQRLGLRSDSSMRFEKSLTPEQCLSALLAAVEMAQRFSKKSTLTPLTDQYPQKPEPMIIAFDPELVRRLSGVAISDETIFQKLDSISFSVDRKKNPWQVTVPSWRATKDIDIPEDLVEEVVRLYGFENIAAELPAQNLAPPRENSLRKLEWDVRDILSANGFNEVYNYSFVNADDQKFTKNQDYISIENPLSAEHAFLRRTLISPFCHRLESEIRTHGAVQFFEIGKTFHPTSEALPDQKLHLALFVAQTGANEANQFFQTKENVSKLFARLGLREVVQFVPVENPQPYFHPSQVAEMQILGQSLGFIGTLHPQVKPVDNTAITAVEINLEKLNEVQTHHRFQYEKVSSFPRVRRDLSLVMNEKVLMGDLQLIAFEVAPDLRKMDLFDVFIDEQKLGKDLKNLAFHLEFQSGAKTLADKDVDAMFEAIVKSLAQQYGTQLRLDFDKKQ